MLICYPLICFKLSYSLTPQRLNLSTSQLLNLPPFISPFEGSKGKVLNIDNEHGKKVQYEPKSINS